MKLADFLVIGGGIIGINIAREIKKAFGDCSVMLIEKEKDCGLHASGRNSGILHAGFYYSPDSRKARFTKTGNKLLTEYCASKNIPVNKCGKLVVAKDERDHAVLDDLLSRGRINGVELHGISEAEAKRIEPRARTHGRALFSPTTSSVDPVRVIQAMKQDAVNEGVAIYYQTSFLRRSNNGVLTSLGEIQTGYLVNAAGLYADRIAREFDFSHRYRILPFKGLYLHSDEPAGAIHTNIYPAPDLRNPFLGVHVTITVDGTTKIGPTAIPAFWRENYSGLENFKLQELVDIFIRQTRLLFAPNLVFRQLALDEIKKYSRARMVSLAKALVEGIDESRYRRWGTPGIRAQLVDIVDNRLEMDFVVEGDEKSMHVLNAVSPGFTCAIPFAQYVCGEIKNQAARTKTTDNRQA